MLDERSLDRLLDGGQLEASRRDADRDWSFTSEILGHVFPATTTTTDTPANHIGTPTIRAQLSLLLVTYTFFFYQGHS